MNRRTLFRNAALLVGGSAVNPKLLLGALPQVPELIKANDIVNVTVSIVPAWPTYEAILADLLEQFTGFYGARPVIGTQDYAMIEAMAYTIWDHHNFHRNILEGYEPTTIHEDVSHGRGDDTGRILGRASRQGVDRRGARA